MWSLELWPRVWWICLAFVMSLWWCTGRVRAEYRPHASLTQGVLQVGSSQSVDTTVTVSPFFERWWQVEEEAPEMVAISALQRCHQKSDLNLPRAQAQCKLENSDSGPLVFWERAPTWWWDQGVEVRSQVIGTGELPLPGEVALTEANWAGSVSSTASYSRDEWVEVANLTSKTFNLKGLRLLGALSGSLSAAITTDVWLAPYGTVLLGSAREPQTHLAFPLDWTHSDFSLPNTDARLRLARPDGTELDSLPGGTWQAGKNEPSGIRSSAQRVWPPLSTMGWAGWTQCDPDPKSWCHPSSQFAWKTGTYATYSTPWLTGPSL